LRNVTAADLSNVPKVDQSTLDGRMTGPP